MFMLFHDLKAAFNVEYDLIVTYEGFKKSSRKRYTNIMQFSLKCYVMYFYYLSFELLHRAMII